MIASRDSAAAWFQQRLIRALDDSYDVRGHSPFAASEDSEPEPDVSVSRRAPGHSHPSEPLLLIEVSESSLRRDREIKARLYAETGVPEYWIVDLSSDELTVEVCTEPSSRGYRHIETLGPDRTLRPTQLRGVAIAIAEIPR